MFLNSDFKKHLMAITILAMLNAGCSPISPTSISPGSTLSNFLSPTSSLTPLPTIPFDEISHEFEELLVTNGGCHLPCFWGITPGKTTIAELFQFTKQFTMLGFEMVDIGEGAYIFRYLTSQNSNSPRVVQFFTYGENIRGIDLIAETAQYNFPLSKILSDYGVPDQVFIGPEVVHALPMKVVYEYKRILGSYYLYQDNNDKSLYCYNPHGTSQEIITWAPDEDWHSFTSKKEEQSYKSLDEVSDYDIPAFREKLRIYNRSLCIRIETDKLRP